MNAKFFDLKQDKQDRIINAALKIFALNGYLHASTDEIVKEAHISKGLLFHYFDSKVGTYSFLYDYCARYLMLEFTSVVDKNETDYFEIRRQIEQAKLQTLRNYPYMQYFINTCAIETIPEAVEAIEGKRTTFESEINRIMSAADMTFMLNNPLTEDILKMTDCTIDAIMVESFRNDNFTADAFYRETLHYLKLAQSLIG